MKQRLTTLFFAGFTLFITILLIKYPDPSFQASLRGLSIWLEIVFPSLLPFFIISELLIGFGVVTFIGVLFEPIMRPLFNVPGAGSFAWIMGMASGYPSGAKISVRLREEKQLTQIEAERLISFTNASSPLFIFGAVSIGFFHDAYLGILIAVCHYLGNASVGIIMRFYGQTASPHKTNDQAKKFSIKRALKEMHRSRLNNHKPFGKILGDAILSSVTTLVMVGGFIILFSVLTNLLFIIGVMPIMANVFNSLLSLLALPIDLALPLITGLFEITIGAQMISGLSHDGMLSKAIIVSFILGFNGLSVQAQVASIIANTDIRFTPYFISRILHGLIASMLTILLFKPLYVNRKISEVSDMMGESSPYITYWTTILNFLKTTGPLLAILSLAVTVIIIWRRNMSIK